MKASLRAIVPLGFVLASILVVPGAAQTDQALRAQALAQQVETLMTEMEAQAQEFPAVIEALRQKQVTIEQADQTVADLIAKLTQVTDAMEDGTEFDIAISSFHQSTVDLIAEAEGSNNDAMKALIPSLTTTKESLEADNARRQETVIEARNVIRELERNREAIAFFIRAGAVQEAAELIRANVDDFEDIVAGARAVAEGLATAANP